MGALTRQQAGQGAQSGCAQSVIQPTTQSAGQCVQSCSRAKRVRADHTRANHSRRTCFNRPRHAHEEGGQVDCDDESIHRLLGGAAQLERSRVVRLWLWGVPLEVLGVGVDHVPDTMVVFM